MGLLRHPSRRGRRRLRPWLGRLAVVAAVAGLGATGMATATFATGSPSGGAQPGHKTTKPPPQPSSSSESEPEAPPPTTTKPPPPDPLAPPANTQLNLDKAKA